MICTLFVLLFGQQQEIILFNSFFGGVGGGRRTEVFFWRSVALSISLNSGLLLPPTPPLMCQKKVLDLTFVFILRWDLGTICSSIFWNWSDFLPLIRHSNFKIWSDFPLFYHSTVLSFHCFIILPFLILRSPNGHVDEGRAFDKCLVVIFWPLSSTTCRLFLHDHAKCFFFSLCNTRALKILMTIC